MRGIAHIFSGQGGIILPASTPYDRELLIEHVARYASRHGCVHMRIGHSEWTVSLVNGQTDTCAACHEQPTRFRYARGDYALCPVCARRELGS